MQASEDHPGCLGVLAVGGFVLVGIAWIVLGSAGPDWDDGSLNLLGWMITGVWILSLVVVAVVRHRAQDRG
jgi:hypothetical protein